MQSVASRGIAAKIMFQAKGPYRVINEIRPVTYEIQKLPAIENPSKKPGAIMKESAARMDLLPPTIQITKRVDGPDLRYATLNGALSGNPLENWLGLFQHGTYGQAPSEKPYAFVKIEEI